LARAVSDESSISRILDEIEKLFIRRRWILKELKKFERKYGMSSKEFYGSWIRGEIPEPEDPDMHGDFMVWAGLIEELNRLERELIERFRGVYALWTRDQSLEPA